MYYTDDPIADFNRHQEEERKVLERLPKCAVCGEPIRQERAVRINGDYYCDGCLDDMREWIGD